MNVHLYASTFGKNADWNKEATPIEVGAAIRENCIYDLRDDTGDNISELNPYFGERMLSIYLKAYNKQYKEVIMLRDISPVYQFMIKVKVRMHLDRFKWFKKIKPYLIKLFPGIVHKSQYKSK